MTVLILTYTLGVTQWGPPWASAGPGWWILFPLSWLALVGLVLFVALRAWWPRRASSWSAKVILAERYAKGEIDHDEYRRRMEVIS